MSDCVVVERHVLKEILQEIAELRKLVDERGLPSQSETSKHRSTLERKFAYEADTHMRS